jgi:Uma2 family endonuclease
MASATSFAANATVLPKGITVTLQAPLPVDWTLADLQEHLGGIPAERIRLLPPPGFATEEDVVQAAEREDRLYELEDGIMVEKAMGWYESVVALWIGSKINQYLETHDFGQVLGPDGAVKILRGKIKIPDVSFVRWERFPKKKLPRRPIPKLVPNLVVEVLSETNTPREMERKLTQYFAAGVELVWYVDPETRSAIVYTSPTDATEIGVNGYLDGGDVLPGFRLSLRELFRRARQQKG